MANKQPNRTQTKKFSSGKQPTGQPPPSATKHPRQRVTGQKYAVCCRLCTQNNFRHGFAMNLKIVSHSLHSVVLPRFTIPHCCCCSCCCWFFSAFSVVPSTIILFILQKRYMVSAVRICVTNVSTGYKEVMDTNECAAGVAIHATYFQCKQMHGMLISFHLIFFWNLFFLLLNFYCFCVNNWFCAHFLRCTNIAMVAEARTNINFQVFAQICHLKIMHKATHSRTETCGGKANTCKI